MNCPTCKDKRWFYCNGNPELGCENAELEHIHICYDCNKQKNPVTDNVVNLIRK